MATKKSTTLTADDKTFFEVAYEALMNEKDPERAAEIYNTLTQDYKGLSKAIDKKLEVAHKAMTGDLPKGRMVGKVFVAPTAFEGLANALRIGAGAYVAKRQNDKAQGLSDDMQAAREYILRQKNGTSAVTDTLRNEDDLDAQEVNWGAEPEMTDSGNMPMIEQQANEVQPNVQEQAQPPVQYPPDNDAQVNNWGAEPPMQDSRPSPLPFGAGMAPTEQTMESPAGQLIRKAGERRGMYPEQYPDSTPEAKALREKARYENEMRLLEEQEMGLEY